MQTIWRQRALTFRCPDSRSYARLRPRIIARTPPTPSLIPEGDRPRLAGTQLSENTNLKIKPAYQQLRRSEQGDRIQIDPSSGIDHGVSPDSEAILDGRSQQKSREVITSIPPNILYDHWDLAPPTAGDLKDSRAFFLKHEAKLLFRAQKLLDIPFTSIPEVAFLGRSNVGKSSLINRLFQKKLATTSQVPGKTKSMNAYMIGDRDKIAVLDLPGYGRASRVEWGKQIMKYLDQRKELRRVFILIDCIERDGKTKIHKDDLTILTDLSNLMIPHQIIITKADRALFPTGTKRPLTSAKFATLSANLRSILSEVKNHLQIQIQSPSSDPKLKKQPGLAPFGQLLAVTAENARWKYLSDEGFGALGIDAVRWAILVATGYAKALPSSVARERKLKR